MRLAVVAGLAAAALLALPAIATAGAPNYDCRIAGGGRIAIDQWAAIIAASGFEHQPSVWGKASTFFQIMAAVGVMAARAYGNDVFERIAGILIWGVAALALISAGEYTLRGVRYLYSNSGR